MDRSMIAATFFLLPSRSILPRIRKRMIEPIAALNYKMQVPFELKHGQTRNFHKLPSGLNLEVIEQKSAVRNNAELQNKTNQPLVFVHGSYHAAWCWAEHWLPFFSNHGFDCYALSLLGQGESDSPTGSIPGTLETHASDVGDFIAKTLKTPPVLLGHSFGGLIVQYYLSRMGNASYPNLSGAALICSVPPTGNTGIVWRYVFSKPITAYKVTMSLAAKAFQTDLALCKETFFSDLMDDRSLMRYQKLMKESSKAPMFDLRKLNASLPVASVPKGSIEVLVLGASGDMIVDKEALMETGRFYNVSPVCVDGVGHDVMLDFSWDKVAQPLLSWLRII